MWFGTEAGLAKFDGRRTQTVNDPSLPTGRVLALQSDLDGALWIGTDGGAARMFAGKFEAIKETAGQTISAIIAPEPGRALMATEQGQVFECRAELSSSSSSISRTGSTSGSAEVSLSAHPLLDHPLESADHDHPGPLVITSLTWSNNRLLAGTLSRGVQAIENGAAKDVHMRPVTFFVRALETDGNGKLWVGARSKKEEPGTLTGDEPSSLVRNEAPTGPVMAIKAIGPEVWVGTDGRGVFRFSGAKTQRLTFDGTAGGLRSDHVYSIFADREGVVWFGTDRGVCRYDLRAPHVESVGDNPESNFVRTLYQTSSGMLLAGTNRGLFVYDSENPAWKSVADLARNIVYAITEDKAGRLLVGSASGFYVAQKQPGKLEEQTFTRVEASSGNADAVGSIRSITTFRGATYFASYGRGVERFDERHTSTIASGNSTMPREVISLLSDADARLFIGTAKDGVLTFDGQDVKPEPALTNLKGVSVRSMARTNDGSLWFATSRGVYLCGSSAACTLAVPNVDARFLLSHNDEKVPEVWCGTTGNGLLRILLDPKLGPVVAQLDSEQGLPSQNVFAVLPHRTSDGRDLLLIGTSRGVAQYEPGKQAPTLFVTRIISKRVHATSELQAGLSLEYPQNSLLLDVTAMSSRTFPEQFQYAFSLVDNAGHSIKQKLSHESQFTMEGLKPGKYAVTVRAFTKDLISSAPLTFELSVAKAPFPWTSTALAILLALALFALLWAILERRRIVATSAELVDANRELAGARLNLANEAERERRRIARDLHDQTLADLRHLALLTDQLKTNGERSATDTATQSQSAGLRQEIESISQEVRRICEDLSPSVLQNVGFAAALEFALSHAVQDAPPEKRFEYEFHCEESLEEHNRLAPSVQMQIYRIVQEAVNNICRHANATLVQMFVTSSPEGEFLLRLEDNGRSFNLLKNNSEGRGLANMHARAGLIDAQLSWEKRNGGGTIFTLSKMSNE